MSVRFEHSDAPASFSAGFLWKMMEFDNQTDVRYNENLLQYK